MPVIIGPLSSDTGVCTEWATEADLCSPCNDYASLGPAAAEMIQAASDVLYELSGRQFPGECEATVRPCARRSGGFGRGPSAVGVPAGWSASWGFCMCGDTCGCGGDVRVTLGAYPIVEITEVKVDGLVVDPSLYRLDDQRILTRLADSDGTNPGWPHTQRIDLNDTEEGTWSVSYVWGRQPPPMGVVAAAVLACELALACDPENAGQCRLPKKVDTITREGVTMVLSPSDFLDESGKTGLYEVDMFIRAFNPSQLRQRAQVWTPNMSRFVRPGT